jgi:hypothetical protein
MANEIGSQANVRGRLHAAGYSVVQVEPKIGDISDFRPDVIAFAADDEGNLVPRVAVEIKSGATKRPEFALPALRRSRELLGTTEHYAVINGQWYRADRGLRSLEQVPGPAPLDEPSSAEGNVTDVSLATSLLLDRMRSEIDRRRADGSRVDYLWFPSEVMMETLRPGIETANGGFVPVETHVLWQARREALVRFAAGSRLTGPYASDQTIARAVVRLAGARLGATVLDPFCGTGSFLWAAMDQALELGGSAEFVGVEIDRRLADLATEIAHSAPMPATIQHGDALRVKLPKAQLVLSAPPFGMRLQDRHQLLNGEMTAEGDLAAIDLCVRHLASGGRAVLHLPIGLTFKRGVYERYRGRLANEFRVAALMGLPPGAVEGAQIRSVLLVIDNAVPGETFVAQLGEDWHTQLDTDGAAINAALQHIDGVAER